jgi:hypothetical protein
MATVMQSDLLLICELTGGRDSRAVLSLMLAAAEQFGKELMQTVRIYSGISGNKDFTIASQIVDEFGLRFMDNSHDSRFGSPMATHESYEKWKSLCLGIYTPVYFPYTRHTPTAVTFGGAGGECHRRFYPELTPEKFLDGRKKFIPSAAHFKKLKEDILQDLASLRRGSEATIHPMVVHYRHFRDRVHGGRSPQYMNMITPLPSAILKRASSMCSQDQINRSQVLADILLNASSELALMPYDSPDKSLDTRHVTERVDAVEAIRAARKDGRVFAQDPSATELGDFSQAKALSLLQDDFLRHYEQIRSSGYFPPEYIEDARRSIQNAALCGDFSHPVDGIAVSHVILAGELSQLSR